MPTDDITCHWRGAFAGAEVEALHAAGFGHEPTGHDWWAQVRRPAGRLPGRPAGAATRGPVLQRHPCWLAGLAAAWSLLTPAGAFLLTAVSRAEAVGRPDRHTAAGRRATAHWLGVPWIVNRDIARGRDIGPPPAMHGADQRRVTAYFEALVRPFFEPGDRVRLTGRRRSRFVTALAPVRAREPEVGFAAPQRRPAE